MTEALLRPPLPAAGAPPAAPMAQAAGRVAAQAAMVCDRVEQVIVGKRDVVRRLLTALTAGGHALLLDVPGVGKTMLAKAMASAVDLHFRRVQFTPDLLPLDVTGASTLNMKTHELEFAPGPVFTNLLLADEINRAPAKTQAALLEAMGEGQVTADGTTHKLPTPFLVIATMNPLDHDGTYALPLAQLDRFAVRLSLGFPDVDAEVRMLDRHLKHAGRDPAGPPALSRAAFSEWQRLVGDVHVEDDLKRAAVDVVHAMRSDTTCLEPPSPRATLTWVRVAMAHALLAGRDFVVPDDLVAVASDVLAHRVLVERGVPADGYVETRVRRALRGGGGP